MLIQFLFEEKKIMEDIHYTDIMKMYKNIRWHLQINFPMFECIAICLSFFFFFFLLNQSQKNCKFL